MPNKKINALLNRRGLVRYLLPAVAILAFAGVGAHKLVASHADTLGYTQILNYSSRAQTTGVTDIQAQVNSIGTQTVSQVLPGAQLSYLIGGKSVITQECYYVAVLPLKGGGTTATVQFTGQGSAVTRQLAYDPSQAGNFQRVCVSSGTNAIKPYNVYNKSPVSGPAVLVLEDMVTM